MASEIKTFSSVSQFVEYIDSKLTELRRLLGELLRVLEDVRAKAEQDKRLRALLEKFGVKTSSMQQPIIELHGFKVAFNPSAETELGFLEQLVENINSKITRLQALRKDIEALAQENIEAEIRVVIIDDVPIALLVKL
ncbi:MAG: hypothetical protein ABWW69_02030 [Pyrodictiaceae archaeon]